MKLLWDKLLVEKHTIVCFRSTLLPQDIYYLFPDEVDALRYIEKLKTDSEIIRESIQFKTIKNIFNEAPDSAGESGA